jgi:Rrf2 family protein
MFSKSFGYALRGILVIVFLQNENRRIQVDEIASRLKVPRFFMSKVLKNLAKHGLVDSSKGPNGGFIVNEQTIKTPIISILAITDGDSQFRNCALRLQECNLQNPCPLHSKMTLIRDDLRNLLVSTTVGDLVKGEGKDFLSSLVNTNDSYINTHSLKEYL